MTDDPIADLGTLVARRRAELELSLREASQASGVPVATLARIERGRTPDLDTFRRVIRWLGVPAERFFSSTERTQNTATVIAEHLRADPALSAEAAERIAGIVHDLYDTLAAPSGRRLAVHLRAAKTFTPSALQLLVELLDEMQLTLETSDRS